MWIFEVRNYLDNCRLSLFEVVNVLHEAAQGDQYAHSPVEEMVFRMQWPVSITETGSDIFHFCNLYFHGTGKVEESKGFQENLESSDIAVIRSITSPSLSRPTPSLGR
jgi:hypothetical protein